MLRCFASSRKFIVLLGLLAAGRGTAMPPAEPYGEGEAHDELGKNLTERRIEERFSAQSESSRDWYLLPREPHRPRNIWGSPAVSFVLPGFDQWWEGQYEAAALYSGSYILSAGLANHAESLFVNANTAKEAKFKLDEGLATHDNQLRNIYLFSQMKSLVGGVSLYHSFRSAVRTRPDDFYFLGPEERLGDLFAAPFDLTYIQRPTTWIPLSVIAAMTVAQIRSASREEAEAEGFRPVKLGGDDLAYGSAFSYNAGTYEEMIFRGWLLPAVQYETSNAVLGNVISSVSFALAHRGTVDVPIAQLVLGYYLGWVSIQNNYSLKESIFIHTWWDVIAFAQNYHFEKIGSPSKVAYWLPGLHVVF